MAAPVAGHIVSCMEATALEHRAAQPATGATALAGQVGWLAVVADRWSDGRRSGPGVQRALRILLTHRASARLVGTPPVALSAGSLALLAPGWSYEHRTNAAGWAYHALMLDGPLARRLAPAGGSALHRHAPAPLRRRLVAALDAVLDHSPDWDWRLLAVLGELGAWLVGARDDALAGRVAALLRADPAGRWRVEELAAGLGMAVSTFAHAFRAEVGAAPAAWVRRWKVAEAGRLLAHHPVAEVAELLGFADPYHFSRVFRRVAGLPPSVHRRRLLALEA